MADNGGAVRRAGRRGLWIAAGIAGVGAIAAVAGVFVLPGWMYTDQAARAALQGGLLTAAAAFTAVAGALIALDETRQANSETRRANVAADAREREANANTHVRELYATAIGLLSAEMTDSRLGGIYALERVAVDSPADQRTVVEVLSAFVREHSRLPAIPAPVVRRPPPGRRWARPSPDAHVRPATDVQAALTVLGRLPVRPSVPRADLTGAGLTGAQMAGADLSRVELARANLTGANLTRANLTNAQMLRANLTDADLAGSNLTGACLIHGNLTDATLVAANLTGALLGMATLTNAWMARANLTGANLVAADLTDARLAEATLAEALLDVATLTGATLTMANLTGVRGLMSARGDARTQLPDGVMRPGSWPPYDPSAGGPEAGS